MAQVWTKFDKAIDVKGLTEDLKDAEKNQKSFKEVPIGQYEIKIEKLELVQSKAGDPMVSCWMKVLSGEFKGSLIFMNQVIIKGFQLHIVNEFLRSLETVHEINFENFTQYGQLLMDIHEAVDGVLEYSLNYGSKKGFSTFEITEVFEVE